MKKFFRFSYESEIRLSLLFLILFLVLINYGIVYLLNLSRSGWKEESFQSFKATAYSASQLWQSNAQIDETYTKLKNLTFRWGIKRVDILNQNGEILISSDKRIDKGRGSPADISIDRFKSEILSGKSFFSKIYPGTEKGFYQSYFYSFSDKNTQKKLFVRIEKEMTPLFWVERISKYEGWVRGLGIIGILFLSLLLLKNIFSPYQKMKRKAEEENIITAPAQQEDVEVVVQVFQKVIAELKEKEKKLQELYVQTDSKAKNLERYNEYILSSINNGVIICDNQGRITGFNQAAQRLVGSAYKLCLNLHYKEVLGEKSSLTNMLDAVVVRKNLSAEAEINIKGDKGEDRFLMADYALLRDENEIIIGSVLVLSDLTELKKIQQEIALKQKMASLGEISAGLAHELRNSMGALLGYCKMLKKGIEEGNATYQIVESIMAESLALENLLQRFLDFAKPLEVKWIKFDLAELIRECIRVAQEKRPELKYSFRVESGLPSLTADSLLLRQVFQNLIQNSIEALENKGEIEIRLQKIEEREKPLIQIIIQDNGSGIPDENLENIFKPFFTSKEKGIGLGLSLVKKIIDLHKGRIEVKSRLGEGTVFTILLPLSQAQIESKTKKTSALEAVNIYT